MRYVYSGDAGRVGTSAEEESESRCGGDPRGAEWEFVPVYRLHADLRRGAAGSAYHERGWWMRAHPAEYEMVSPLSLGGALQLMHEQPGQWLPIAGATEVMVLFGAGKLSARRLVNLWGLRELQGIRED